MDETLAHCELKVYHTNMYVYKLCYSSYTVLCRFSSKLVSAEENDDDILHSIEPHHWDTLFPDFRALLLI